jgi:type IV secretory pathway VirB2 component (pilin)
VLFREQTFRISRINRVELTQIVVELGISVLSLVLNEDSLPSSMAEMIAVFVGLKNSFVSVMKLVSLAALFASRIWQYASSRAASKSGTPMIVATYAERPSVSVLTGPISALVCVVKIIARHTTLARYIAGAHSRWESFGNVIFLCAPIGI